MHDAADPCAAPLCATGSASAPPDTSCAIPAHLDASACATGSASVTENHAVQTDNSPPKRLRGRPRRFDAEQQRRFCLLVSVGLSRRAAARHVGVPPSSIVYAARRDPRFQQQLLAAEHARANRPPELADIGRRAWRAQRRLLQSHNVNGTRPPNPLYFHPEFRRTVRKLVRKYFRKCLAELSIFENSTAPPFRQSEHSQQLAASRSASNLD